MRADTPTTTADLPRRLRPECCARRRFVVGAVLIVAFIELLGTPAVRLTGADRWPATYLTLEGQRTLMTDRAPAVLIAPMERSPLTRLRHWADGAMGDIAAE